MLSQVRIEELRKAGIDARNAGKARSYNPHSGEAAHAWDAGWVQMDTAISEHHMPKSVGRSTGDFVKGVNEMTNDPLQQLIRQLNDMIESFAGDPADTDYQRGYKAALIAVRRMARDQVPASFVKEG